MLRDPVRRALCVAALLVPVAAAVRAQAPVSIAPPVRPPQLVVSGTPETPVAPLHQRWTLRESSASIICL